MGQWRANADLPATLQGPGAARHAVATLLRGWRREALIDDAQLVVSELVTNAILHAPGQDSVELELVAHAERLRITVTDRSTLRPVVAEPHPERPRGRGMRIVDSLAIRWGVDDDQENGKRVWVELELPPRRPHLSLA
jgi:anti-sigma regulatory factor (Ser/Thr protein kinase)